VVTRSSAVSDLPSSPELSSEGALPGTHEVVSSEVKPAVVGDLAASAREGEAPVASSHAIDHDDPIAAAFFRRPDRPVIDVWEETQVIHAMSRGSRRAMYAAIGFFAVSLTCIAGYAGYQNLIMPAPVALGAAIELSDLPTPPANSSAQPSAAGTATVTARTRLTGPRLTDEAAAAREAPATTADAVPEAPVRAPQALPPMVVHAPAPTQVPPAPVPPQVAPARASDAQGGAPVAVAKRNATNEQAEAAPGVYARTEPLVRDDRARDGLHAPELSPTRSALPPSYDELLAVGQEFSRKNRRKEAIEAFQRALIQAPDSSPALSGLSYVYLNASDYRRAQDFAERSVGVDATNSEGWIVLGAARDLLGDRSGALAAYRSCVAQGKGRYLSQCRQVAR
jgi:hypothetical protein